MNGTLRNVYYSGQFKVTITKDGLGRHGLYYFLVQDGYWHESGGPFGNETQAKQAAEAVVQRATVGRAG